MWTLGTDGFRVSLQISVPSLGMLPLHGDRQRLAAPESHPICPATLGSLRLNSQVLLPEEGGLGVRQAKLRGSLQRSSSNGSSSSFPIPNRHQAPPSILLAGLRVSCPPPSRSLCPCVPRTASLGKRRSPWASIPAASSVLTAFLAPSSTKLQVGLTDLPPCPTSPHPTCPALGSQDPSSLAGFWHLTQGPCLIPGYLLTSWCREKSSVHTVREGGKRSIPQPGKAVTDPTPHTRSQLRAQGGQTRSETVHWMDGWMNECLCP